MTAAARRRRRAHGNGKPDPASSILKIKGTEIQQATTELLMEVGGPYAMPDWQQELASARNEPSIGARMGAQLRRAYFNWRKTSIYGGTNEIQRNIIAKAILGL